MSTTDAPISDATREHLRTCRAILWHLRRDDLDNASNPYLVALRAISDITTGCEAKEPRRATFADVCDAYAAAWYTRGDVNIATQVRWGHAEDALRCIDSVAVTAAFVRAHDQHATASACAHCHGTKSIAVEDLNGSVRQRECGFCAPDESVRAYPQIAALRGETITTHIVAPFTLATLPAPAVTSATSTLKALRASVVSIGNADHGRHEVVAIAAARCIDALIALAPKHDTSISFGLAGVTKPVALIPACASALIVNGGDAVPVMHAALAAVEAHAAVPMQRFILGAWTMVSLDPDGDIARDYDRADAPAVDSFEPAPVFDRDAWKVTGR